MFQAEFAAAALAHTRKDAEGTAAGVCHETTAIDFANWEFEVDCNVYCDRCGDSVFGSVTFELVQRLGGNDGKFVSERGASSHVHLFARDADRLEVGVLELR